MKIRSPTHVYLTVGLHVIYCCCVILDSLTHSVGCLFGLLFTLKIILDSIILLFSVAASTSTHSCTHKLTQTLLLHTSYNVLCCIVLYCVCCVLWAQLPEIKRMMMMIMQCLHVKYNYFKIISAFVDVRLK